MREFCVSLFMLSLFYDQAPVVQRIECKIADLAMRVRFPPGAPDWKSQRVLVRLASLGGEVSWGKLLLLINVLLLC